MIARKILARKPYAPEIRKIEPTPPELVRVSYQRQSKRVYVPPTAEQKDAQILTKVRKLLKVEK